MKDQYFGDVNDYVTYGLLRCLREAGLTIGVCWMLTPPDRRADGNRLGYLGQPARWRRHDSVLFDALKATVGAGAPRETEIVEREGLIPGAYYFREVVPQAEATRDAWFRRALRALAGVDLLFFDPDNGFEVPSSPPGSARSVKYLRWPEVKRAWETGSALLLFQHFARREREAHAAQLVDDLRSACPRGLVISLHTAHVLFLLVAQPGHQYRADLGVRLAVSRWDGRVNAVLQAA